MGSIVVYNTDVGMDCQVSLADCSGTEPGASTTGPGPVPVK